MVLLCQVSVAAKPPLLKSTLLAPQAVKSGLQIYLLEESSSALCKELA